MNSLRRSGERTTEEIDVVGTSRKRVTVVGEVKWTSRPLTSKVLGDLADYKIPALEQGGFKLGQQLTTVLFSRSGFTDGLHARADENTRLVLIDTEELLSTPP